MSGVRAEDGMEVPRRRQNGDTRTEILKKEGGCDQSTVYDNPG